MLSQTMPRVSPPLGLAWPVWCVIAAWCVQGGALLAVGATMEGSGGSKGVIDGAVVASELGRPLAIGIAALGIASFLGCALVAAGQRHAQTALLVVGIIGALACASDAPSVALVVLVAMVTAVVLGLTTSALDHLYPVPARNEVDAP